MSLQNGIRANLHPHREQRVRFKQRSGEEAFGVYRPLTPESMAEVSEVLGFAARAVKLHLQEKFPTAAELKPLNYFGTTFVQHTHVKKRMRAGLFQRGFQLGQMIDEVKQHAEECPTLLVPIEHFDWFGARWDQIAGRKLATGIDPESFAHDVLKRQASSVREMLKVAEGNELGVEVPSHISLMKYGRYGDHLDLNRTQRSEVSAIVEEQFDEAGLHYVELGRLIIGAGYTRAVAESQALADIT